MRNQAVGILVLLLAACEPTPTAPPASPSSAPPSAAATEAVDAVCGQVIATSEPSWSDTDSFAVFPSADGLSLYDIRADAVTVIDPTPSDWGPAPQFRTPTLVSFVRKREPPDDTHTFGQDSMYELDLEGGGPREMLRLPNYLLAFEWSPDRAVLAYLVEPEGDTALCLFDSRSGLIRHIRTLSHTGGRGVNQRDERSIAWSPDATNLLVLDTLQAPSIYVVDIDGKDIFSPQTGAFARWLSHDVVLFAKGSPSGGTAEKFTWAAISTETGVPVSFGLPDAAFRPALSPAGGRIAFDDGARVPTVFVFDIDTGTARSLARGYVGPVWLGPDLIGATAAEPAPPNEFADIPWATLGSTIGIDPETGEHRSLALPATLESPLQGEIDVLVSPTQAASELLATLPEVAGGETFDLVQVVNASFRTGHLVDDVLSELQKERSDAVSVFRGGGRRADRGDHGRGDRRGHAARGFCHGLERSGRHRAPAARGRREPGLGAAGSRRHVDGHLSPWQRHLPRTNRGPRSARGDPPGHANGLDRHYPVGGLTLPEATRRLNPDKIAWD